MKRNITLDYTKLFFSFLVIMIHNPLFWEYRFFSNIIVNGICRIAVPCFFVLNGMYLGNVLTDFKLLKKYVFKLMIFYGVWMLIYAPFFLFHFKDTIEISIITNLLNIVFGFWHLWYIAGLIGAVIILYILKQKRFSDTIIFKLALLFFIFGWLIQKIELFYPNYEGMLGSIIRSNYPSRNFLFMGFPFVALGYLISKIDFAPKMKSFLLKKGVLFICFLLLFIETTIQFYMIGRRGFDFYIILFVLCPLLILVIQKKSKIIEVQDDFISKLSAAIYFIHPLILFLIKESFSDLNSNARYTILLFFSIIFGSALIYANKRLKIFF